MQFEWDVGKAEANYKKHGVRFSESLPLFEDDYAITLADNESDPGEVALYPLEGRKRASAGRDLYPSWSEYPHYFSAPCRAA
jgi:hypothetical protein